MKYADIFFPATCDRYTIYFDFADELENISPNLTWFCTDGFASTDTDIPWFAVDRVKNYSAIASGKTKSFWISADGGDRDALSEIREAAPTDPMYKQFRNDFKSVCGFYPETRKEA